ncbi:MAG: sulfatase-like hydrolase/transferase [Bryobacterales bacterium]|nr:sulfatase-like hydrolase/transferase [Bryobacterales bacterium]
MSVRALILLTTLATVAAAEERPNVVLVLIDDLGYGDLSCYGNNAISTPNIDALAAQGVRFEQFYVASPICSPSRVGITTGQHPSRHLIHSFLNSRHRNEERGMRDYLDPAAPAVARTFQNSGYATAHFGKWHMGGGRDVDDAPLPQAYGFQESLVSFEGLGDRVLPPGGLSDQSRKLGQGKVVQVDKHEMTEIYVDRAIDFVRRNRERPFYLHLWLNDVHDRFYPKPELLAKFERFSANPYRQEYFAVIDEMDRQLGRLFGEIDDLGLGERTILALASDNGPTAWKRYYDEGYDPPGSTAGLRGRKWSLYEGGIREPLIVRWTGNFPSGRTNSETVISALDLFPTFCALAGIARAGSSLDGLDMSAAFRGAEPRRSGALYWEYGRDSSYLRPGLESDRSPALAVRDGEWKLLMNADGNRAELYDFREGFDETENIAAERPEVLRRLRTALVAWWNTIPQAR